MLERTGYCNFVFVSVSYQKFPQLCLNRSIIGHSASSCRRYKPADKASVKEQCCARSMSRDGTKYQQESHLDGNSLAKSIEKENMPRVSSLNRYILLAEDNPETGLPNGLTIISTPQLRDDRTIQLSPPVSTKTISNILVLSDQQLNEIPQETKGRLPSCDDTVVDALMQDSYRDVTALKPVFGAVVVQQTQESLLAAPTVSLDTRRQLVSFHSYKSGGFRYRLSMDARHTLRSVEARKSFDIDDKSGLRDIDV